MGVEVSVGVAMRVGSFEVSSLVLPAGPLRTPKIKIIEARKIKARFCLISSFC